MSPWQKCKRFLGLFLFWLSWVLWIAGLAMPVVLDSDAANMAVIIAGMLIAAEISFAVSLFFLGRPFYEAIKQRLKSIWYKVKSRNRR